MDYIGRHLQCVFYEAEDGIQAEHVLQECHAFGEPIDLIVLDWMMPKLDGFGFLKKIRATEIFKVEPKIIMLTAETYATQIEACLKYGVSFYLTKPFTEDELSEAVKSALEGELKHAV